MKRRTRYILLLDHIRFSLPGCYSIYPEDLEDFFRSGSNKRYAVINATQSENVINDLLYIL